MRRNRRKYLPTSWIFILVLIVFGMGMGYSVLESNLNISGTSNVDSVEWDVYFDNVRVTDGSVTAPTPVITDKTTLSFSADLDVPEDFYEFKVDVVNNGSLDAKLNSINILPTLSNEEKKYFDYTVSYENGLSILPDDALDAGDTKTLLIKVKYLYQNDVSQYPTEDKNFDFNVSMNYVQGKGLNRRFVFAQNFDLSNPININMTFPSNVTTYNTFEDYHDDTSDPVCLRYYLVDNVVKEIYAGFVFEEELFFIKGGDEGAAYNSNKEILDYAFGSENCVEDSIVYSCSVTSDDRTTTVAYAYKNGEVETGIRPRNPMYCGFYINGNNIGAFCD